jgi:hypothetical protein
MAKYAIVELNKVASRKTGEIEAQCKLADEFKKDGIKALENGAIVYIKAATDEIVSAYDEATCVNAKYLHFSNPRRYEDGKSGMENFRYETSDDKYLPRLFKLTVGDIFTTNYDLTGVEGIVEIKGGNMPYGTLPSDIEGGKTYRVIA